MHNFLYSGEFLKCINSLGFRDLDLVGVIACLALYISRCFLLPPFPPKDRDKPFLNQKALEMCPSIILINFTVGHNQKKGNQSSRRTGISHCGLQSMFFIFISPITSWHIEYWKGGGGTNGPGMELALPRSWGSRTPSPIVMCSMGIVVYR